METDDRPSPLHLRLTDLRRVTALLSVDGSDPEGKPMTTADYNRQLQEVSDDMSDMELLQLIHRLQTDGMTEEERLLSKFTRYRLKKLSNWDDWDLAFDAQLDAHNQSGCLGTPILKEECARMADGRLNILRLHWTNVVKPGGKRKARACIDGSKRRSAPWLRTATSTYSSCIDQHCLRLFVAISAAKGHTLVFADTSNAFQQSPPPEEQCYLAIDEAYTSWYHKRYGKRLDPNLYVIPLQKSLQGHPTSGVQWERMISGILTEVGFKSTTQERNIYHGTIDGELVLVCRQVDDFMISSKNAETCEKLIAVINAKATTGSQGIGDITSDGIMTRYNGVDISQCRDHVKLSCTTYIDRLLQTHGWSTPEPHTSDMHKSVPMLPDNTKSLMTVVGPAEGTREAKDLESQVGYSYRQLLGELMYAYVVCRLDIGHAVTMLSRFSTAPAREHYEALKHVAKYLRRTRSWGLMYWRDEPVAHLPHVPFDGLSLDPSLPEFPSSTLMSLVGFVDASHATCIKTRRSTTGMNFCFAGAAVAYKVSLQGTVATSSTEAEFIASVTAAKMAKYLRSVLRELNMLPPDNPTVIYIDNEAAIAMINERKPTTRSRHIDIQYFAIQEWRARGEIITRHIPGVINPADDQTKPLYWKLHERHARRAMGHYGHPL